MQRGADEAAIKAAYRRLAKECHPDRKNGCKENEAQFKAISEAYDVLKDPQKRAAYDRFGKAAFQNGGGGTIRSASAGFEGFSDIFSTIFGEFMDPRGARQNAARGADLRYDLELTLEEAFTGVEKTITVEALARVRQLQRPRLHQGRRLRAHLRDLRRHGQGPRAAGLLRGRARLPDLPRQRRGDQPIRARPATAKAARSAQRKLSVKIPAGVDEGTRIRVAGEGEAGVRGAPSGDLYLFVHMKRHPIFAREGTTLIAECPVSFTTAALGGSISLPGLDGNEVEIKIPAGHPVGRAAAPSRRRA